MLSKPNRLSLKTDRFRIEKAGKTLFSNLFTYIIAPRPDPALPPRFTILTSKKNFPLSVTRHHLKRQLTEILRHHLDSFRTGYDIILIPKKSIITATSDQILSDLQKMFIKLYQRYLSPINHFLGRSLFGSAYACRFTPTCSQYYATAVAKYGIIHGSILGLKRLFNCHPYTLRPHLDPVP